MSVILHDPIPTDPTPAPRADDGHAIEHPSWCSAAHCTSTLDVADELLVVHRHLVLDEPRDAVPCGGRVVVDVVRGDIVCARGGELLAQDATAVRVRGVAEEDELTPAAAARLAVAVARAAEIAGGAR